MSLNVSGPKPALARMPEGAIRWSGRMLTGIPVLLMLFSASMKCAGSPQMVDELVHRFGYPANG